MTARLVMVGFDDTERVPAWTRGEYWNGWLVPYFTADQTLAACNLLASGGAETLYDATTDAFYTWHQSDTPVPEDARSRLHDPDLWGRWDWTTIETPEGVLKVWSLGGFAFTWQEGSSDDPSA